MPKTKTIQSSLSILLLLMTVEFNTGCHTSYQGASALIDKGSRVGVVLSEGYTLKKSYIYDILIEKGLDPVALNDIDVKRFMAALSKIEYKDNSNSKDSESSDDPQPVLPDIAHPFQVTFYKMQPAFREMNLDYVLLVDSWGKALDHQLSAVVIQVDTMRITGVKFYKRKVMAVYWATLSLMGISYLICPFMYAKDPAQTSYRLLNDFISKQINPNPVAPPQTISQPAVLPPPATATDPQLPASEDPTTLIP